MITYRDLRTVEEYAQVVELERIIWGPGYEEVVPIPILAPTVLRGGILIGAFETEQPATSNQPPDRMVGFVYSIPGIKHGKPTHTKLGVIVEEYEENVYGTSSSPLHAGNPTDRFVAEWWIRQPCEERGDAWATAETVNRVSGAGEWLESVDVDLSLGSRSLLVDIPMGFTEMLSGNPELALAWRICTRAIFTTYFDRGYRAVDFRLDRPARKGTYLLCLRD